MTVDKISVTQTQSVTWGTPTQGRFPTHTPRRGTSEEPVHLKVELDFYSIKWFTVSHLSPGNSAFLHKGTSSYLPRVKESGWFWRNSASKQHDTPSLNPSLIALKIGHYPSCPTTFWVEHPATIADTPTGVFLIYLFMKFIMQNVLYHLDSHLTCCTEIYVYRHFTNLTDLRYECAPVWFIVCWISKNMK